MPNHHDSGLCFDCPSRPSARPPRLWPVLRLLIAAVPPTTTTSACAAVAQSGRLCNRRGFGLCLAVRSGRPSNHHDFGLCLY